MVILITVGFAVGCAVALVASITTDCVKYGLKCANRRQMELTGRLRWVNGTGSPERASWLYGYDHANRIVAVITPSNEYLRV